MRFIRRHLLIAASVFFVGEPSAVRAEPIQGAGSSFAAPVIHLWGRLYERSRADGGDFSSPEWKLDYEPVGSLAGIMRLQQPGTDFAATDAPLPPSEVAARNYLQFPIAMGGVAIVTNIDGAAQNPLRLDAGTIADIFLGNIRRWNDPAIQSLNSGAALPAADIQVIHRSDGSGTTLAFAQFLAGANPEWKSKVGADTELQWPVGKGARGSSGVAAALAAKNTIGYIEFGQANRAGLPAARLANKSGHFVAPNPGSIGQALVSARLSADRHFMADTIEAMGPEAYPLVAITYAIVPKSLGAARQNKVFDFFTTAFDNGRLDAASLGFVPLPNLLVNDIKSYWRAQRVAGR